MKTSTMSIATDPMHVALAASARSTEIPEELDLYGWFVGSWELELTGYDDVVKGIRTTGEAHCARMLEAHAVQDVFTNPRRSDRGPGSPKFANWFATRIRICDPSIQAWRVNWFNPHDGIRAELIGRRRGKDIVQEGQFPDRTPIRWTFSETPLIHFGGAVNDWNPTAERGGYRSSSLADEWLEKYDAASDESRAVADSFGTGNDQTREEDGLRKTPSASFIPGNAQGGSLSRIRNER